MHGMPFYLKRWPQGNVRRRFQVKWVAFGPSEMFESWADPLAMTEAGGSRVGSVPLWDSLTMFDMVFPVSEDWWLSFGSLRSFGISSLC